MVSGRYNDIFLQYITTLAIMVSAIICTCVHLSPPMLQITDEEVNALAGNQEVSLTSTLTDVYPKVQANFMFVNIQDARAARFQKTVKGWHLQWQKDHTDHTVRFKRPKSQRRTALEREKAIPH